MGPTGTARVRCGRMPDFTLTTSDGVVLRARRHGAPGNDRAAVVLAHGFSASMDHPEVVAVVDALVADGHCVISYDARGHRSSGGLSTLGDAEAHDVAAAVQVARDVCDRVVTVGASMGAIAALRQASAGTHGLVGVVAVSSPATWNLPRNLRSGLAALLTRTRLGRRLAARRMGVRIHPEWGDPAPPEELAEQIEIPLAVVHGHADPMIPFADARRLAAAAAGPTRLEIIPGMRHAFDARAIPTILASVRWALTGGAPRTASD